MAGTGAAFLDLEVEVICTNYSINLCGLKCLQRYVELWSVEQFRLLLWREINSLLLFFLFHTCRT